MAISEKELWRIWKVISELQDVLRNEVEAGANDHGLTRRSYSVQKMIQKHRMKLMKQTNQK